MNKIRDIIRLAQTSNLSKRKISRALNISRPAVDHYLKKATEAQLQWDEVKEMDDEELLQRLERSEEKSNDPRYSELKRLLPDIAKELGKKHVTKQLLWEEYRTSHPDGYEYSQFCYHLQMYTADSELAMHLSHEPGEKVFIDFSGDKPTLTDPKTGIERKVELFVSVFPAGSLIYAEAVESQRTEDVIGATRSTFEYAEGSPTTVVPDNMKAAVTEADTYEPVINQSFEDFARYYGCAVIPARPRKPKDKALVEAAVYVVYTRVLAPLRNQRFGTLEELNTAIWEKLDLLNERKMRKFDISRRERFEQIEKPLLAPLPSRPYIIRHFLPPATVQKNYHVYFKPDGHYYSVPYRYRKKKVRIAYTADEVEIYFNNSRIAAHIRERRKNGYTTTREHMPSQHKIVTEWNPQRFLNWASTYGSETKNLISRVIASCEVPEQAYRSCLGILNLSKKYNSSRLEAASARANYFGIISAKGLKNILEKGLDRQESPKEQQLTLPTHENIRGHSYYERGEEVS